jgi:hypothetical protein
VLLTDVVNCPVRTESRYGAIRSICAYFDSDACRIIITGGGGDGSCVAYTV